MMGWSTQFELDDFCGCCGRECYAGEEWCRACAEHVLPCGLPPWDRTWFAQYGVECPFT